MAHRYLWQVVEEGSDAVCRLPAGGRIERDIVADVLTRAQAKGIGVFRTEARVLAAIETSLTEVLSELRKEVKSIA